MSVWLRRAARQLGGYGLALLLGACSGGQQEPLQFDNDPLPGDGQAISPAADSAEPPPAGSGDRPLTEPSSRALSLIGGQTGSDIVPESNPPGTCPVIGRTDYEVETLTPLGVSGADAAALLTPQSAQIQWATGPAVAVALRFEVGPRVTLLDRVPGAEMPCADVLQVPVQVTLSSDEPGIEARWSSFAYLSADGNLAGLGLAGTSELGAELRARSGDVDGLELLYEVENGVWKGWLSHAGGDENEESTESKRLVAEISGGP